MCFAFRVVSRSLFFYVERFEVSILCCGRLILPVAILLGFIGVLKFTVRSDSEMALGKKCTSLKLKRCNSVAGHEGYELGLVNYTRGLGRKRIVISNNGDALFPLNSSLETPLKKRCGERMAVVSERSPLEALPQDILVSPKFSSSLIQFFFFFSFFFFFYII